jgi:hypothetical protein
MAMDLEHHHLFLGCGNQKMMMLDSGTGKVLVSIPIGEGVDANCFDPGTGLAFSSCGRSAVVTIARAESPDKLTVVQSLKTETGARTMALDTKTHKIYLASAKYESGGEQSAPGKRPRIVAGSFKILVYGPEK